MLLIGLVGLSCLIAVPTGHGPIEDAPLVARKGKKEKKRKRGKRKKKHRAAPQPSEAMPEPASEPTPETTPEPAPETTPETTPEATPEPAPAEETTDRAEDAVLVLPLRAKGVPKEDASGLTSQLAEQLAGHTELRVITIDEIKDLLEHQSSLQSLGCDDDSCIAQMSRLANAGLALSGSIGLVGEAYVLGLSLLDTTTSTQRASASRQAQSLDEIIALLPEALAEVFGWDPESTQKRRFRLAGGEQVSLAVFDIKPMGIEASTADNLTQLLAVELKRIDGTQVVSRDDIVSMLALQSQKDALGCEDNMACLAEIGGALGVDKLVVGNAGKLGDQRMVALRLIDVRSSVVENRVSESFDGAEDQLIPAIRVAGWRLLGLDPTDPGALALSTSEMETEVFLDGEKVGVAPLPPLRELSPGKHSLHLVKDGFVDWRSDIYIEPAGTTPVWVELQSEPPAWYERWWVWTIVGVAVVGGTAAAVFVSLPASNDSNLHVGFVQ